MMKLTRGLESGREFHRGSVRAEGSSASWWPWLPEIMSAPKIPAQKEMEIGEKP